MKTLLFICGANGIGKTTVCHRILNKLENSAYVDSDPLRYMNSSLLNPLSTADEVVFTNRKNISSLIKNYLDCPLVETVIFSYGFHGHRKKVFDDVMDDISGYEFRLVPFLLICDEDENIRRMQADGRDEDRIRRAVEISRKAFGDVIYPQIDVTNLTPDETADKIINLLQITG